MLTLLGAKRIIGRSNENGNGLLREFYPKQNDLAKVTQQELRQKLKIINNRPRKCLNRKTPLQVFLCEVSHFSLQLTKIIKNNFLLYQHVNEKILTFLLFFYFSLLTILKANGIIYGKN